MLEAEIVEATIPTFRQRMAAVERLKNEEGEHEEAVLRFFFGNLFVNFSLLWKPTIALIDEFSAKLESKDQLWGSVQQSRISPQFVFQKMYHFISICISIFHFTVSNSKWISNGE